MLGIGLESEGGHHPNGDLTVTKKTKRVKVCGTKIGPTMREYFFIHLHGRNPWGGRQRGWHPPEVGDKGVWHASILSQLRALHGARCQCQEQSTCAATVCQLSEGSHQPCELSHHPLRGGSFIRGFGISSLMLPNSIFYVTQKPCTVPGVFHLTALCFY